jgi:Skp family chaperone for outer membrane proteins
VTRISSPAHLAAGVLLCLVLAGCQGRGLPVGTPPGGSGSRHLQIAVVDFDRAARAHPRWPELEALDQRIADLQARLAVPSAGPAGGPQIDLSPQLRAAAQQEMEQLRPEIKKEFEQQASALQSAARKELDAYVAKLRADEQAEFDTKRAALEAQARAAIDGKQQAMVKDNEQYQRQILEQYRLPLLNLRLKLEAVQQTNKQEGDKLAAQVDALTKERDDKIAAHEKANEQAFGEFQKQQMQQYAESVAALQQQLTKQGQALIDQKTAEINARLHTQLSAKQAEITARINSRLRTDLNARQAALVQSARQQFAQAQARAQGTIQAREAAEQVQLKDARDERARLLATILADLRVDATELGQQKGYDVILTQVVAAVDAADITDELIARLKR